MPTMGFRSLFTARRAMLLLALMAVVVAAHLFPAFSSSGVENALRDSLHIVGFAFIGGVLFETLPLSLPRRIIITLALVAVLGGLSELVQAKFVELDTGDLTRDIAGAAIFVLSRLVWTKAAIAQNGKKALRVASILIGCLIFVPLIYWSGVYASYARQFPVILDFEAASDRLLLDPVASDVSIVDSGVIGGDFSGSILEIEFLRRSWTGIRILPVIVDWSDYQTLSFQIAMVGGTQPRFEVRLSDGLHPGFRSRHYMAGDSASAQPKRVSISLRGAAEASGRPDLDISNIIELHIVGKDQEAGTYMYLDEFRLE